MFLGNKSNRTITAVIVDRQIMLKSDKRYSTGYISDFEMCRICYDYLNEAYSFVNPMNPDIEGKVLSDRNVACMNNALIAFKCNDLNSYWHELADFIHNYNSKEPVSYNEYQVFKALFEIGK